MNRFIKFFTGKASTEEELELMKWAKESKANEDELLRSLRWFQTETASVPGLGKVCICSGGHVRLRHLYFPMAGVRFGKVGGNARNHGAGRSAYRFGFDRWDGGMVELVDNIKV